MPALWQRQVEPSLYIGVESRQLARARSKIFDQV